MGKVKVLVLAGLMAWLPGLVTAQTKVPTPPAKALIEAALKDDRAYAITRDLSTDIGPRLAGTEAEARARDWAVARLTQEGFTNARVETFPLTAWERIIETATIIGPHAQRLEVHATGGSPSTPAEGIVGEVVRFADMVALRAAAPGSLTGKIAFVDDIMPVTEDGSGYGKAVSLARLAVSSALPARLSARSMSAKVPAIEARLAVLMQQLAAPYAIDDRLVNITVSIGVAVFPQDDANPDTLLRHADQAMYAAKQAGRNRFHQFDAAQERALQLLRAQGHYLREALAQAQFILYLQPKVDMRSGTVVGAEVLSRWQHPERGLVSPGEFLPLLEGTDLEIGFGEWVAEAALTVLGSNVDAQHLQQPDFADWVAGCLARHPRVPAHLVEIEITESAALYDLSAVADTLNALRAMGVTVALDDFGTGYSSLTYLRRLPMDTLKIAQSFVH
eukprot:gene16261-22146_t